MAQLLLPLVLFTVFLKIWYCSKIRPQFCLFSSFLYSDLVKLRMYIKVRNICDNRNVL